MEAMLVEKLDNIHKAIKDLNRCNILQYPMCICGCCLIIAFGLMALQCHHEETQREINRQNALVQIYKTIIEEASSNNMSKIDIQELFYTVNSCLNQKNSWNNETSNHKQTEENNGYQKMEENDIQQDT